MYAGARLGELLDLSLRDDKSRHSPEKKLPEGVSLEVFSRLDHLEPRLLRVLRLALCALLNELELE